MEDIETALAGLTFASLEEPEVIPEEELQPEAIELVETVPADVEPQAGLEVLEAVLQAEAIPVEEAQLVVEELPMEGAIEPQPVEITEVAETTGEVVEELAEGIAPVQEAQVVGEEEVLEEEPTTLDEIFALRPEALEYTEPIDDEEEEEDSQRKKKKKKKKKYVEVEYDPEQDVVIYKKKRKRGVLGDWDDNWEI
jgi:hypothetical protein